MKSERGQETWGQKEEEGDLRDVPRGVPRQVFLVEEDAHQLGDRERGVGLRRVRMSMF